MATKALKLPKLNGTSVLIVTLGLPNITESTIVFLQSKILQLTEANKQLKKDKMAPEASLFVSGSPLQNNHAPLLWLICLTSAIFFLLLISQNLSL